LTIYAVARIHSTISSRLAVWAFTATQQKEGQTPAVTAAANENVDLSLWSTRRIAAYKSSLALKLDRPLAVLSIPRLRLTAPVFEGTDTLTLNRGLGRIHGTASPGQDGNIGIAGHRDGFFRALRGVSIGDAIEIATTRGRDIYIVDRINIVDPSDIEVLKPKDGAELTLVTCYPFNFIGGAPRRYIVQASLKQRSL
jgi:sortase A